MNKYRDLCKKYSQNHHLLNMFIILNGTISITENPIRSFIKYTLYALKIASELNLRAY